MSNRGKEKSITKDQYRVIYESRILNGDTLDECSKKSGVSVSYVVKISTALRILDNDLDFVYSLPANVLAGGREEIKKYASRFGKDIKEDLESDKKIDSLFENGNKSDDKIDGEFSPVVKIKEGQTLGTNSIYGNSINYQKRRGKDIVTHYIPDYRRVINPKTVSTNYEYGGILFSIDEAEKTITFKNLDSIMDSGDDISCGPGEFNKHNIKTLISYGEALVGIGMFFQSFIK